MKIVDGVLIDFYESDVAYMKARSKTWGYGINVIGDYAFENCKGLEILEIPDKVLSVGKCAFYYCTNLREITFPSSVTKIEGPLFIGCKKLEKIVFEAKEKILPYLIKAFEGFEFDSVYTDGDKLIFIKNRNKTNLKENEGGEENDG